MSLHCHGRSIARIAVLCLPPLFLILQMIVTPSCPPIAPCGQVFASLIYREVVPAVSGSPEQQVHLVAV